MTTDDDGCLKGCLNDNKNDNGNNDDDDENGDNDDDCQIANVVPNKDNMITAPNMNRERVLLKRRSRVAKI